MIAIKIFITIALLKKKNNRTVVRIVSSSSSVPRWSIVSRGDWLLKPAQIEGRNCNSECSGVEKGLY